MSEEQGRGFAGLSSLVSDSSAPTPATTAREPLKLIDLMANPTMAAIWSSADAGETWVWGDYVLTFQTEPERVADHAARITGKGPVPASIRYLYAVSVFYRQDRCPFGNTSRPILSLGVEQLDAGAMLQALGADAAGEFGGSTPPMVGMFTADTRLNLGEYAAPATRDAARKVLFEHAARTLEPEGSLERIGTLADAFGNEKTGFPAQQPAQKEDSRCFVATAAFESVDDPCVRRLRALRDATLLQSGVGRRFVDAYYRLSPSLADAIETRPTIKRIVRVLLRVLLVLLPASAFEESRG